MKESSIERKTCKLALEQLGVRNVKLVTPGDTGWPDRIFWIPGGRPLLIEFKAPGEAPRPKQIYIHELLRQLGYNVEVHDDTDIAFQSIARAVEAARLPKKGG